MVRSDSVSVGAELPDVFRLALWREGFLFGAFFAADLFRAVRCLLAPTFRVARFFFAPVLRAAVFLRAPVFFRAAAFFFRAGVFFFLAGVFFFRAAACFFRAGRRAFFFAAIDRSPFGWAPSVAHPEEIGNCDHAIFSGGKEIERGIRQ